MLYGNEIEEDDDLDGVGGIEADGLDGEDEVSINLEDAIATAEEINKQEISGLQQQIVDGFDGVDDDDIANEIAGIVTDGHHEEEFDRMRE